MNRTSHDEHEVYPQRGAGEVLLRLVKAGTTTEDDWRSHYEQGKPPRKAEIASALDHIGLSMWDRSGPLERLSEMYGERLGRFIAEVRIAGEFGIWLAATGPEGHFTVWGRPGDMQRCVRGVHLAS